jgi:hypothetical protein
MPPTATITTQMKLQNMMKKANIVDLEVIYHVAKSNSKA